jgi:hypothetical protein
LSQKQQLPVSADADRHRQADPKGDSQVSLAPPSRSKAETPAQQLRRRQERFDLIADAVQKQLNNCSGRMHMPDRFISDFEFLYLVRRLPVGAGLSTPLVTRLMLDGNRITSVEDVPWPPSLTHISLRHNLLTSVTNARWPPHLRCLNLDSNAIQLAAQVPPPPTSTTNAATTTPLPHAAVALWPLHLTVLDLGRNKLSGNACAAAAAAQRAALTSPPAGAWTCWSSYCPAARLSKCAYTTTRSTNWSCTRRCSQGDTRSRPCSGCRTT